MKIPPEAKCVFKGIIFDVYQWEQKMFDGSTATFEMLKRPNTLQVIAADENYIYLGQEEQPGKGPFFSLFGGRQEPGEDPLAGAKRELLEESGLAADDWELLKQVNLPFVQHVNGDGTFKTEVKDFAGMEVKPRSDDDKVRLGTDIEVIRYLQEHGTFFSKENITHSYPHCWRCDTPLLNYATSSWFVKIEEQKKRILDNARSINWSPAHIKKGRWGKTALSLKVSSKTTLLSKAPT